MIKQDEDALICDLAEVYGIYDYRRLPASKVAVFSVGLNEHSRIMLALSDQKISTDTFLMASIADSLNLLVWFKTADGQNGINRPISFVGELIGHKQERDVMAFTSGEEFEEYMRQLNDGGDG